MEFCTTVKKKQKPENCLWTDTERLPTCYVLFKKGGQWEYIFGLPTFA